jgi:hypothetical protein
VNPELISTTLKARGLTSDVKAVLLNHAMHADHHGFAILDVYRVSDETCLSVASVRSALAECASRGLLVTRTTITGSGGRKLDVNRLDEAALKKLVRSDLDYGDGVFGNLISFEEGEG